MGLVVKYTKKDGTKVWGSSVSQRQRVSSKRVQTFGPGGVKLSDNQRKRVVDYYGNVNWVMPGNIRAELNYRPSPEQIAVQKSKSLREKDSKNKILPTETQAKNSSYGVTGSWNNGVQTMENKSLKTKNWYQRADAFLGGVLPFGGTSAYATADKRFFKGFLPGGTSRTDYISQYSIPAIDQKSEVEKQYQESKDRLESTKQMSKLNDKETDYQYKLAQMQQELTFKQAEESLKQELDASNQAWYEVFNKQERALEQARANIGREQEARNIEQNALALREQQDYSSLDRINRSVKDDISQAPGGGGFGAGMLTGGASTALLLGLGAVLLLKK